MVERKAGCYNELVKTPQKGLINLLEDANIGVHEFLLLFERRYKSQDQNA
jgi:hypothetical protein